MRLVVAALLLLGLLPLLPSTADELATAPPTNPAIRQVDLVRRLQVVASDVFGGRETGTPGSRLAAEYIAGEMTRAGLAPAGDDDTFFQAYAIGRPVLGAVNALHATRSDGSVAARLGMDFNPFSMSRAAEVEGPLVFAGYGITAHQRPGATATGATLRGWDDYAGLDARGKVVLVFRKDPGWNDARHAAFRAKVENAAAHGAVGLLLCNDPATTRGAPDEILDWSAPSGLPTASAPLPCAFVTQALAAELLGTDTQGLVAVETALRALGPNSHAIEGTRVHLRTEIKRSTELDARNVAGFLQGTDPSVQGELVLIGAHFDHLGTGRFGSLGGREGRGRIHPGADDNGSGTVALLELAEYFASPAHRPRRSLLFVAFSGEELGLLGSSHYVRKPLRPLEKTVAMINLDMIGRLREERLHVIGVGTGKGLADHLQAANAELGLTLRLNPQGEAGADSLPFFRKQIPVLFFFTGFHDDYHRPSDTADAIEFAGLERVTRLVGGVVQRIADASVPPSFTRPPPRRRPPVLGIALGNAAADGVRVAAVTAGGAAAEAGLAPGDVIVDLGGRVVRDARTLRTAIQRLEPGRKVKVVVLRAGRRIPLEVVPRVRKEGRGR